MRICINKTSKRAVYKQIVKHIKYEIAIGRLVDGEKLPTIRHLSDGLILNSNTIAKADQELQQERIAVVLTPDYKLNKTGLSLDYLKFKEGGI